MKIGPRLVGVLLASGFTACQKPQPASAPSSAATPAATAAPTLTSSAAPARAARPVDASSPANFTSSVLELFRSRDAKGGWSRHGELALAHPSGIVVNLDRFWQLCQKQPSDCNAEVEHLADEALKIVASPSDKKVAPQQLMAVVRATTYFDGVPADVRASTLSEPLLADLLVVYVVDNGGNVRGAQSNDLVSSSVTRAQLPQLARKNLAAALGAPDNAVCQANSFTLLASGNYYESSRLLLSDFWSALAQKSRGPLIVAAPASDALVVACDPSPSQVKQLQGAAEKIWAQAERPLTKSLLQWTPGGWKTWAL